MDQQLKNQHFTLLLNGKIIADLAVDGEGRPALHPQFNRTAVGVFLAVMTLIYGEYPTTSENEMTITLRKLNP